MTQTKQPQGNPERLIETVVQPQKCVAAKGNDDRLVLG